MQTRRGEEHPTSPCNRVLKEKGARVRGTKRGKEAPPRSLKRAKQPAKSHKRELSNHLKREGGRELTERETELRERES